MIAVPDAMTAAVTERHGGPDAIVIRHDWPVPAPEPGEVLVEVRATAVNNTDIWSREGAYGTASDPDAMVGWKGVPLDFPRIQGADVAGVIVEVGRDADGSLVGRRVLIDPALGYEDDRPTRILGSEADGGFAEFVVAPAERVHDVTDSPLSDEQLACLPIAYATALGMIERAKCAAGERVLVTGASGGVGLAAIQILRSRGCDVAAVTSSGKEPAILEEGADEVYLRDSGKAIEGSFDLVIDLVGGDGFGDRVGALADHGRLVTAGAIAGPVVTIDLRQVYLRHRSILGSTMHTPRLFEDVVLMARGGSVSPRIAGTFPLIEIHEAQTKFMRKEFVGKLVLVP